MINNTLQIYTDGSCKGNPGKGGWSFVAVRDGQVVDQMSGSVDDTTNNRMELYGLMSAMEYLRDRKVPAAIYSDSKYLVLGLTEWIHNWKKKGWRKSDKKPVENQDLWKQVDSLFDYLKLTLDGKISIEWVQGHTDNGWNNLADELAQQAAEQQKSR